MMNQLDRRLIRVFFLFACTTATACPTANAQGEAPAAPPVFADTFETDSNWIMFEEIVDNNPCYDKNSGQVARTSEAAYNGVYSLNVWANQQRSNNSNHVIAYKSLSNFAQQNTWRYAIHSYIPVTSTGSGQTGPEFSIQNTKQTAEHQFLTANAGIQYNASPFSTGTWSLWVPKTSDTAKWQTFLTRPLQQGQWYTATIEANFTNNSYMFFTLQGPGTNIQADLSSYRIGEENKEYKEESFVISLESENLWNNCGIAGIYDYQVFYDSVQLGQVTKVMLPLIAKAT